MGIIQYSARIKFDVLISLKICYLESFPEGKSEVRWRATLILIWANRVLRTLFWYALLGPLLFLFLLVFFSLPNCYSMFNSIGLRIDYPGTEV